MQNKRFVCVTGKETIQDSVGFGKRFHFPSIRRQREPTLVNSMRRSHNWRDGRVVEGARLESVFRGNSNVGSNPTLSASLESITYRNRKSSGVQGCKIWIAANALTLS